VRLYLIGVALFLVGLGTSVWTLATSIPTPKPKKDQESVSYTTFEIDKQFVVPIIKSGSSVALVVLAIGIEIPESELEHTQTMEPKIRDMFLSTLLALGNRGVFDSNFTSASAQTAIKSKLLERSKSFVNPSVRNVFILSIARQELN